MCIYIYQFIDRSIDISIKISIIVVVNISKNIDFHERFPGPTREKTVVEGSFRGSQVHGRVVYVSRPLKARPGQMEVPDR